MGVKIRREDKKKYDSNHPDEITFSQLTFSQGLNDISHAEIQSKPDFSHTSLHSKAYTEDMIPVVSCHREE